jgi:hypothetical protein
MLPKERIQHEEGRPQRNTKGEKNQKKKLSKKEKPTLFAGEKKPNPIFVND